MSRTLKPLTTVHSPVGRDDYVVVCRECGDVTSQESGGYVHRASLPVVGLYRQRHLAKHLAVLSEEIQEATR
ncbi:MAG TPA: hypothetical protein VMT27_06650 [Actinomycetes bacterium]|nr:hypothetical protein [Actinomycetes bacterium]